VTAVAKNQRTNPLRVLIAGGGTGGHIIPALAVARELVKLYRAEILFVGTPRGMESRLIPAAGFDVHLIEVGQLKNVSMRTRMRTFADLPRSIFACRRLISQFRPDVVFGVGGYASGPAMAAAIMLRIPTMAFEPNAMPGLANRLVGKRVQAAAVNFPAAARWFRNSEVTGIPVRPEFFNLAPPQSGNPHLLVFGGSQGARLFNVHLPAIIAPLLDAVPGLTVLHQSGSRAADQTFAAFAATGADPARWHVEPFLDDMPARFSEAHLIMGRSGASSVAELAAAGKPSLLVPFAAAADEHQKRNAEAMVDAGAALMLEEPDLEIKGKLLNFLVSMFRDSVRLSEMGVAARAQAHPDAAQRIADRLAKLAKRGFVE
jgi:UDP-N-acetylglucosamine--N-acetylmuramyl-(pentapeptide) pyrophosphoryl-undecaprenol N-acetylglucosamine transferase